MMHFDLKEKVWLDETHQIPGNLDKLSAYEIYTFLRGKRENLHFIANIV